jgi:hypothetical protein
MNDHVNQKEIFERVKLQQELKEAKAKIEAANKILDLADFEDLTGAHKIYWSNWQALRDTLKFPRKENQEDCTKNCKMVDGCCNGCCEVAGT